MKVYKRVDLPSRDIDAIDLCERIKKQHAIVATASPINGVDMADFDAQLQRLKDVETQIQDLYGILAPLYQEKANILGRGANQTVDTRGTLLFYTTQIRDVLLAIYKGMERNMATWGFRVVLSTRSSKGADLVEEIVAPKGDGSKANTPADGGGFGPTNPDIGIDEEGVG